MSKTLVEIAQQLKAANKKVQLIYAFNGVGKTRLSQAFRRLIAPKQANGEAETESARSKILYYNAFTEDLFYWDNDLALDAEPKLKIQPNTFTDWILQEQGHDRTIISNFQRYVNDKLTPRFNETYSAVTFSLERGDDERSGNLKISKGEESNFIWSVFYTLLDQVISIRNVAEPADRETNQFDHLEYVFVDDPVSSLDENHLIQLAVDLAQLIKANKSDVKFIITTHNPLFYNVLFNELSRQKGFEKYRLEKQADATYQLVAHSNDSPFSYHLYLMTELEKAVSTGQVHKYHFNFLRNILEKTATFLGYNDWVDLLPTTDDGRPNPYEKRIINISSHSKHAGEEVMALTDDDKRVLTYLITNLQDMYRFKKNIG
ncbi:AAA family ATPase [Herpetosiphon llansteffanensis]|uniref:AAA family ATPase n=1 Tax=Herpetosiphon llansteffanensis TaxID=2094568 RepID=UPI000D7BBE72|nr:AAA family ATPase [Herpetosiphon llansteffanensis]